MTRYGSLERKPRTGLKKSLDEAHLKYHNEFSEREYSALLQLKEDFSNSGISWKRRFELGKSRIRDIELSEAGREYLNDLTNTTYNHIKRTAGTSRKIKDIVSVARENILLRASTEINGYKEFEKSIKQRQSNPTISISAYRHSNIILPPEADESTIDLSGSEDLDTGKPVRNYSLFVKRAIAAGLLVGAFVVYQVVGCAEENSQPKKRQNTVKTPTQTPTTEGKFSGQEITPPTFQSSASQPSPTTQPSKIEIATSQPSSKLTIQSPAYKDNLGKPLGEKPVRDYPAELEAGKKRILEGLENFERGMQRLVDGLENTSVKSNNQGLEQKIKQDPLTMPSDTKWEPKGGIYVPKAPASQPATPIEARKEQQNSGIINYYPTMDEALKSHKEPLQEQPPAHQTQKIELQTITPIIQAPQIEQVPTSSRVETKSPYSMPESPLIEPSPFQEKKDFLNLRKNTNKTLDGVTGMFGNFSHFVGNITGAIYGTPDDILRDTLPNIKGGKGVYVESKGQRGKVFAGRAVKNVIGFGKNTINTGKGVLRTADDLTLNVPSRVINTSLNLGKGLVNLLNPFHKNKSSSSN